jgi:hypothetical protein
LPKVAWICASRPGRSTSPGVDLVDDDEPVHVARRGVLHHAHGHRLDAHGGVDDHGGRLHRFQRGQALAQEVGAARGVDEVHARVGVLKCITAAFSECCILRSSGSKSLTVEPRSRVPGAPMAPVLTSSASARLVFPAAAGPTRARVRMAAMGLALPGLGLTWCLSLRLQGAVWLGLSEMG